MTERGEALDGEWQERGRKGGRNRLNRSANANVTHYARFHDFRLFEANFYQFWESTTCTRPFTVKFGPAPVMKLNASEAHTMHGTVFTPET